MTLVSLMGVWFVAGGIQGRLLQPILVGLAIVTACELPLVLWYRHGTLFVDAIYAGKTSLLGMRIAVAKTEVAALRTVYAPQPNIALVRRDGSIALRFNRRWWREEQLSLFAQAVGVPTYF